MNINNMLEAHFDNKNPMILTINCDVVNVIIGDIVSNSDDEDLDQKRKMSLAILNLFPH